jgi:hypothetical protein
MSDKNEIARRYGFETYAGLLDISERLPKLPGDTVQSYLARHPKGNWFVWEDVPVPEPEPDKRQRTIPRLIQ